MKTGKHSIPKQGQPAAVRVASTVGVALAGTALAGLSAMQVFGANPEALAEGADGTDAAGTQSESGASATSTLAYSQAGNASEKSETVYVFTEAGGSVKNIEVSSELKNADGAALLRDQSTLSGIENTEGDEEYSKNAEGLVWDAQGKDIYYKGASDAEAPIDMKVTYWLDGKKVAPADLAGKSGKVKIRYEYENHSYSMRSVNGAQTKIYTPFVCITGLVLDNDTFKNVEVDGGKAINDGDRTVAAGLSMPGMADNLDLGSDVGLNFPEYLEITADVSDFELGRALTMATSDVFDDVDTDKLDTGKIEDALGALQDGIDQLISGSRSLAKGLNKLSDGTSELKSKTAALPGQAKQLSAGAQQLASGLKDAVSGSGTVSEGATSLSSGMKQLKSQGTDPLASGASELASGLASGSASAKQSATQAAGALGQVSSGLGDAASGLGTAASTLSGASESWNNLTAEQKNALSQIATSLSGLQTSIGTTAKGAVDQVQSGLSAQASAEERASSGSIAAAAAAAKQIAGGLSSVSDSADTLASGAARLASGASQLESGISSASSGAGQIASGTSKLAQATPALVSGIKKLDSGALAAYKGSQQLVDGLKQYNEEGIQKLVDAYNDNVAGLGDRVDAIKAAGSEYQNFSGKADGTKGSVRFVFEADAIEASE